MPSFTESTVEDATLEYFAELGYSILHGPDIGPDEPAQERASYGDVVLPKLTLGEIRVKEML